MGLHGLDLGWVHLDLDSEVISFYWTIFELKFIKGIGGYIS